MQVSELIVTIADADTAEVLSIVRGSEVVDELLNDPIFSAGERADKRFMTDMARSELTDQVAAELRTLFARESTK